ncbi:MAG: hypothetical protein IKB42_05030 [Clostridia bacterium]|nr:hypothetical protein [Clostridia bacterium]
MSKNKQSIFLITAVVINFAIFVLEVVGIFLSAFAYGWGLFVYYTQLSNIFALLVSASFVAYGICVIVSKSYIIPLWLKLLRFMVTCCLAVTMIVVFVVLIPMIGEGGFRLMVLVNATPYHHLICPLLSIISFIFFELKPELNIKHTVLALVPTIIYGLVMFLLNLLRVVEGPYPFLLVYNQPWFMTIVWAIAIFGLAYTIGWALYFANAKIGKVINKNDF